MQWLSIEFIIHNVYKTVQFPQLEMDIDSLFYRETDPVLDHLPPTSTRSQLHTMEDCHELGVWQVSTWTPGTWWRQSWWTTRTRGSGSWRRHSGSRRSWWRYYRGNSMILQPRWRIELSWVYLLASLMYQKQSMVGSRVPIISWNYNWKLLDWPWPLTMKNYFIFLLQALPYIMSLITDIYLVDIFPIPKCYHYYC